MGQGTVRVAVETAVRLGWDCYIGADGGSVGMSTLGASGTEDDLWNHFGITPERVVEELRKTLVMPVPRCVRRAQGLRWSARRGGV